MKQIFLITDYHNRFGTKFNAIPYRSGMDKTILKEEFSKSGLEAVFLKASEVFEKISCVEGKMFLYTSSEDRGHHYKSFLEDIILTITEMNGLVIPKYFYLRAHNNKVIVELLRKMWGPVIDDGLRSFCCGSYQELSGMIGGLKFPVVVKRPEGFKSRGVFLARNLLELNQLARKLTGSFELGSFLKDRFRTFIHPGFIPESQSRRKFVVQEFIPGLQNDWKILIYGDKYFIVSRRNRKNDFRASGSGLLSFPAEPPIGLLDFCEKVFRCFDVPMISMDIAFDGSRYHLLEVQFIYFGTYTIQFSEFFFRKVEGEWAKFNDISILENDYVRSVMMFIEKKQMI